MPRWIIPAGVALIIVARAAVFLIRHAADAVRLSGRPCGGGTQLVPGVYQCW